MAVNYGFERGKYGCFPGTIIAFPRTLDGKNPNDTDHRAKLPAGFLRCDGSILNGNDYPNLNEILGVGANSKFRKGETVLKEDNAENADSGGTFQLPDLGAKSIIASNASGVYTGDTVDDNNTSPKTIVPKVGIGADVTLNQGTTLNMNYSGAFSTPQWDIPFISNQNWGTNMGVVFDTETANDTGFLMHSHFSNLSVWAYSNTEDYSARMSVSDASPEYPGINSVAVIGQVTPIAGSQTQSVHQHTVQRTFPTRNTNDFDAHINAFTSDGFNVVTETKLVEQNTIKMDDIVPKYIIVEFFIKF